MIQVTTILCPIDLSDCSRHALDHALAIARWYGASITALHVFPLVAAPAYAPGIPGFTGVDFYRPDWKPQVETFKQFVLNDVGDVPVELRTREGNPAREILAAEEQLRPDLIVIGTHGRTGIEKFMLGSVAEKVLRKALSPVLSVPPRAPHVKPVPVNYRRILCPVDFSDCSREALKQATSLAQEADARLTLLHVLEYGTHEWPELYAEFSASSHVTVSDLRKRNLELSRERLELAVSSEVRKYCTVETALTIGKPYETILRVAGERACDLIVMGVRGHGALDRVLFGSTTQHVVRLAPCPVLTVRGRQDLGR